MAATRQQGEDRVRLAVRAHIWAPSASAGGACAEDFVVAGSATECLDQIHASVRTLVGKRWSFTGFRLLLPESETNLQSDNITEAYWFNNGRLELRVQTYPLPAGGIAAVAGLTPGFAERARPRRLAADSRPSASSPLGNSCVPSTASGGSIATGASSVAAGSGSPSAVGVAAELVAAALASGQQCASMEAARDAAACKVQAAWRRGQRSRQEVEAQGAYQAFLHAAQRRRCHFPRPDKLLPSVVGEDMPDPLTALDAQVALALANSPCEGGKRFLRWLEARIATFVVSCANHYEARLAGLGDGPQCFQALAELTQSLMRKLSVAFPWFAQFSMVEEAQRRAESAARDVHRRRTTLPAERIRQVFVVQISTEVIAWAIECVEDAIFDVERGSAQLGDKVARLLEHSGYVRDVLARVQRLKLGPRPWLVRLLSPEAEAPKLPQLMLVMMPGEHFGGVFRAACACFECEYAQLFTKNSTEPLRLEGTPEQLQVRGVALYLRVCAHTPALGSFDQAVMDVAKALGPFFEVSHEDRLLRVPNAAGHQEPEQWKYHLVKQEAADTSTVIFLPHDGFGSRAAYYHLFTSATHELVTAQCTWSSVLEWLQQVGRAMRAGDDIWSFAGPWDVSGSVSLDSLMQELDEAKGQVARWSVATVGAQMCRKYSRHCKTLSPEDLGQHVYAALSSVKEAASSVLWPQATHAAEPLLDGSRSARPPGAQAVPPPSSPNAFLDGEASRAARAPPRRVRLYNDPREEEAKAAAKEPQGALGKFFSHEPRPIAHTERARPPKSASDFFGGGPSLSEVTSPPAREDPGASSSTSPYRAGSGDDAGVPDFDPEGSSIAPQSTEPELTRPAIISVAASSAVMLVANGEMQWVAREVQRMADGSLGLAIPSASVTPLAITASASMAGAAVGSVFGPVCAGVGALAGAALAGQPGHAALTPYDPLQDHGYTMRWDAGTHRLMLTHTEMQAKPDPSSLFLAIAAQASIKGCVNMWYYANGEMSGKDVYQQLLTDVRTGVAVFSTSQAVIQLLQFGQEHAGQAVASYCHAALGSPAPTMFFILGAGWLATRLIDYNRSVISKEQLRSAMVLSGGSCIVGALVGYACGALALVPPTCAAVTYMASNIAGIWVHEAWRAIRQREAEAKLRTIALEVMGLTPQYSQQQLGRRWRLLARVAHPDVNTRPDARKSFIVFRLCFEVLQRSRGARARMCPLMPLGLPAPPSPPEVQELPEAQAEDRALLQQLRRRLAHSELGQGHSLPPRRMLDGRAEPAGFG